MNRTFNRPENLLRSYLGLGPSQMDMTDVIVPTLDISQLLTSNQDQQISGQQSAALAPGASTNLQFTPPFTGYWLLDFIGVETEGPRRAAAFERTSPTCARAPASRGPSVS